MPEAARITFRRLGTDDPAGAAPRKRTFQFATDTPAQVVAAVAGTTGGRVQVCIHEGTPTAPTTQPFCADMRASAVRARSTKATTWTVTVVGTAPGTRPVTDLTLTFPSAAPRVLGTNLRFQGRSQRAYNGIDAVLDSRAGGSLGFQASWADEETGGAAAYELAIVDTTGDDPRDGTSGTGTSASHASILEPARAYAVAFRNTAESVDSEVLLTLSLSWP